MTSDQERFNAAANRLEELKIHMDEIIEMMRDDGPHTYGDDAYAQVYELRREVGYVVRVLGTGVPAASDHDWHR